MNLLFHNFRLIFPVYILTAMGCPIFCFVTTLKVIFVTRVPHNTLKISLILFEKFYVFLYFLLLIIHFVTKNLAVCLTSCITTYTILCLSFYMHFVTNFKCAIKLKGGTNNHVFDEH